MGSHIHFSPECLDSELLLRLESHIAAGHPWKQLLQTASKETVGEIFQTLQAYTSLWLPFEPGKRSSASFDKPAVLELFNAAEQDLERGLSFIRDVEKGSHMRAEAVLAFRPEAIKALCDLCRGRIDVLKPRRGENDREDDEEDEAEAKVDREEKTSDIVPDGSLVQNLEAVKSLIGTVYRHIEPQFKTRLQFLVHKHKAKARSK